MMPSDETVMDCLNAMLSKIEKKVAAVGKDAKWKVNVREAPALKRQISVDCFLMNNPKASHGVPESLSEYHTAASKGVSPPQGCGVSSRLMNLHGSFSFLWH
jgi:hypothetical protein